MELRLLKRVENLSLGPQDSWPLDATTQFAVPLTLSEQRKVGIRGSRWSYDSRRGGRELVSRAARLMALSPDYSIRRAFDFE